MIIDETNMTLNGDDLDYTVKYKQNNIPILEQAYIDRMSSNNGMSKDRLFQKVALIPEVAIWAAEQEGYNMNNDEDVMRYLKKNPEFLCCNPWVKKDSNAHKIIIK